MGSTNLYGQLLGTEGEEDITEELEQDHTGIHTKNITRVDLQKQIKAILKMNKPSLLDIPFGAL